MATLSLLALAAIAQPNKSAERVSARGWRKQGGRPIWTAGRPGHHRGRLAGTSFRGVDRDVPGTAVGGARLATYALQVTAYGDSHAAWIRDIHDEVLLP